MILKLTPRSLLLSFLILLQFASNDVLFDRLLHCDCLLQSGSGRDLANVNLSLLSYETIHKLAIRDQVRNHVAAQKSLETRLTKSLNGLWDFCFDDQDEGFLENWHSSSLRAKCRRQANFYRMPVPSAFNDLTSSTKAQDYIGWFWYQTSIPPASEWAPAQLAADWHLQFESVNYLALVWVAPVYQDNSSSQPDEDDQLHLQDGSTFLGSHVGGHLPFVLNLTNAAGWFSKSGQATRLTVAVSNRLTKDTIPSGRMLNLSEQVGHEYKKFQPDFDFFHFAGIMGSVNLFALKACHFSNVDTLTTLKSQNQSAIYTSLSFSVCHQGCLKGSTFEANSVELEAQLLSSEGLHIGSKLILALNSEGALESNSDNYKSSTSNSTGSTTCTVVEFAIDQEASKSLSWRPASGNQHYFAPILVARFELTTVTRAAGKESAVSWDLFRLKVGLRTTNNLVASTSYESSSSTGNGGGGGGGGSSSSSSSSSLNWGGHLLQGFGMHHEQLFSGRTMSLSSIMKDIYLLKSSGANLLRTSHYPYSNEYLDACDENGIMVIAECPAVGLNSFSDIKLALHKQILREMMERDHHHPSIIMWSVANEPQSQKAEAEQYFKSLLQFARQELAHFTVLAGRPLTAAIAQPHRDDRIGGFLDVIMVNRYFGWYDYLGVLEAIRLPLLESLAGWSRKHPDKGLLLSEFGADSVAGLHSSTRLLFSEEYQRDLLVEYERVLDEIYANKYATTDGASSSGDKRALSSNINFIGSMIWNFADFSTHDSLLRVGGNRKGVFTRQRQPKLAAQAVSEIYLNRSRLRAEEANFSAIVCEMFVSNRQAAPVGSSQQPPASACNQNILY